MSNRRPIVRLALFNSVFTGILISVFTSLGYADAQSTSPDPNKTLRYFANGSLSDSLNITLGDPKQWGQTVEGFTGKSAGGKVQIKPGDYRSEDDGIQAIWSDDAARGELAIYGPPIDLSAMRESSSLMFDVKVNTPPTQSVEIGMDCGFPCRAEYDIGGILRAVPEGAWTAIPLPLTCFQNEDFDLSKIGGVFMIGTAGQMDLTIANIRVQKTPEGLASCPVAPEESATAGALNPDFFYFINGQLIGQRGITLGDPGKWGQAIEGLEGRSATRKIQVEPVDFQQEDDAMHITWSRSNVKGELGIYGPPINIQPYKNDAALTFDVKVHRPPRESVKVGMDCGYPCRAEFEIGMTLRRMNSNTWTSLPIPLNCLTSSNFDLSKINGVFLISTSGRLELSIANIRLEQLPEGSRGCSD